MATKQVEVITGTKSYDTKILIDGVDIAQELGVYGVDIRLRVNEVPTMTIFRRALNARFACESCDVKFKFDENDNSAGCGIKPKSTRPKPLMRDVIKKR